MSHRASRGELAHQCTVIDTPLSGSAGPGGRARVTKKIELANVKIRSYCWNFEGPNVNNTVETA